MVPEGTQIIETKAFDQVELLSHIILPFSLKEIIAVPLKSKRVL